MEAFIVYRQEKIMVSEIIILDDDGLVAIATLGGRFNEQQALREYAKQPHRFTSLREEEKRMAA